MSDDVSARAEGRLEDALAATGAPDPREPGRARLRELRGVDPEAYEEAVTRYREVLLPQIADGEVEPLAAWTDYGARLAAAVATGRTVCVDATGRARPYGAPAPPDALVLHLPDDPGRRAMPVARPAELSSAQEATLLVLVEGRQKAV